MAIFKSLLVVIQVLTALGVIVLVLLQHGKGADMGAAFGSGSSGSLFGATGSANFLSRTTGVLAAVFFASTLGLTMLGAYKPQAGGGVMERISPSAAASAPAASAVAPVEASGPAVPK